jgi:hypothetical protein
VLLERDLSSAERTLFGWTFEVEPRRIEIALAECFYNWVEITLAEGLSGLGAAGRAPFKPYFGIYLASEESHGKPPSGWQENLRH